MTVIHLTVTSISGWQHTATNAKPSLCLCIANALLHYSICFAQAGNHNHDLVWQAICNARAERIIIITILCTFQLLWLKKPLCWKFVDTKTANN